MIVSSVDWSFLWQGQHEVARRLAAAGHRVLYVENTGVRSPRAADAGRVLHRLGAWLYALRSNGIRRVAPNLYVCSPLVLPPLAGGWRRAANRRVLLPLVRRAVRRLGLRDPVLWTYLPTDTAIDLVSLLRSPRSVVVYSCLADFAKLTPRSAELREAEATLVRNCDLVFAQGSTLVAHCRRWSANVVRIRCGVSLEAFPPNGHASNGARQRPRAPVIGYVGGLHRHVDLDMLASMARARDQWRWIYVGTPLVDVRMLSTLENVQLVEAVPHADLAAHLSAFDVCIIPYLVNDLTETVFPTKLNEYLAMSKPVVSTPLPAVREFDDEYGVVVTVASGPRSFLHGIERALASNGDGNLQARRRQVAELHSWRTQLEWMADLIERRARDKATGLL